jgi:hypothetical protein
MEIQNGTTITVQALEWREDWEFDHPTVILSPVRRYSPNGDSMDEMIESLGINACVDGRLEDEEDDGEFEWRGWSWNRLRRVFLEALKGKTFPKKGYRAKQVEMRFFLDEDNNLTFATSEV